MQAMDVPVPERTRVPAPGPEAIVGAFAAAVNAAGDDPLLRQRLGIAAVAVALEVRDVPGCRIRVSLSPDDVRAQAAGGEPVDVELTLDALDVHELMVGGLALPMKIATDGVAYRGPVRRFLRVIAPLGGLRERYLAAIDAAHSQPEEAL